MKRLSIALALALAFSGTALVAQAKGPVADTIYFDVRTQEEIGLKDTAEGKTDVFFYGVQGNTYGGLPQDVKSKLDVYAVPSGSWSLQLNPAPNKAPYQLTVKDKVIFNPLAIQKVRFALNFLLDRKKMVDEIMGGAGEPMYTMATPGQPGTYKYNLIASKFGFKAGGDETRAIRDITAALEEAAQLPENTGKLVKGSKFWEFNGEPILVRFMIRADDPNGRLKGGRYIADQIEKAGIKVERMEMNRGAIFPILFDSNPANFEWSMYTEGWGAGATRAWWDQIVAQMYAPWYTNMPGGGNAEVWNYEQADIDSLTKDIVNGKYLTSDEYWTKILKATEIGVADSVRVYLASQMQYYVTNKAKFNERMAYGLGDGFNAWTVLTANPKTGKTVRMSNFSAKGALFISAWNPVGTDGFNDVYSQAIAAPMVDMPDFEHPATALDTPLRVTWKNVDTKIAREGDNVVGQIPVSPKAVIWNTNTKKWETGTTYVQDGDKYKYVTGQTGLKAYSTGTYTYKLGKWHNGQTMTLADLMYASAFAYDWSIKSGDNDKEYDSSYATQAEPALPIFKGVLLNADGTVTTWFDFNHVLKDRVGHSGALGWRIIPGGIPVFVSWDITEALARMVADGAASGTVYSFTGEEGKTEVDVLNPKVVADIKAKLKELADKKYVPVSIQDWVKPEVAVAAYNASIKFIDSYGHAFISNGSYMLKKFDSAAQSAELAAVRDASYPYAAGYWNKALVSSFARIDNLKVGVYAKGKPTTVTVNVSAVDYPSNKAVAAAKATVKVTLVADGKETVYTAKATKAGVYEASIPAADGDKLKAGAYTVVAESALGSESPAVESGTFVKF